MKYLIAILFTCVTLPCVAQTNFVRNPSFEAFSKCPEERGTVFFANFWRNPIDSLMLGGSDYLNACANAGIFNYSTIPDNAGFYQYSHSGKAMATSAMYYDKTSPPPPPPYDAIYPREYTQGHLFKNLILGKKYCVSFWVNLAEESGYAHNKIGAYLDDGSINKLPLPVGSEITSVAPQVYTNAIIKDTMNWVKIEGSFVAKGNETYITIGNFFPNDSVSTEVTNYWFTTPQYSYYLIDDVSVVPIDTKANAGVDKWVELGKNTQIGPVEDSTARGMDCKWYKKGVLIDSGNVITVKASTIKYAVDTYVVVQNVCGNITRDTMLLRTVGLGMTAPLSLGEGLGERFRVHPNPSNGKFVISCHPSVGRAGGGLKLFDILGRLVQQEALHFTNKDANLNLNIPSGTYILELKDEEGNVQRERLIIE